jgi:hypothetical protein
MLRLWNGITKMDASRLPKIIYNDMQAEIDPWLAEIKSIFDSINAIDVFERNVPIINLRQFCQYAEKQLVAHYSNTWCLLVESKPKLHFYKEIKHQIATENYCSVNLNRSQRSLVAKLRMGIFPINVELGRYRRLAREDRTCPVCNSGDVEDELHVLFHCVKYQEARNKLLTYANSIKNLTGIGDISNFEFLTTHERLVRKTSNFLKHIITTRQNILTT